MKRVVFCMPLVWCHTWCDRGYDCNRFTQSFLVFICVKCSRSCGRFIVTNVTVLWVCEFDATRHWHCQCIDAAYSYQCSVVCQGVYNYWKSPGIWNCSWKYWKSPGIWLMLLENFIISSVIFARRRVFSTLYVGKSSGKQDRCDLRG